ncbi:UNVERIFIED_ORG: NTP pyrophosphatase (non-canonical NTP hydrolase) [Rhizobium esperanzae]
MEIVGTLRNARRVSASEDLRGPCLHGQVYGDTKGRFRDGEYITTSTITAEDGDVFKTRYSAYRVEHWEGQPVGPAANDNHTFTDLRSANLARQKEWDADNQITGPVGRLWKANELAGECGEASNAVKKLVREEMGIRGSRDTVEHLAEELADVVICADLLAAEYGIDLNAATRSKFNATSENNGLRTRMVAA